MSAELRKGYEVIGGIITFPQGTKVEWIYPEAERLLVLTNMGVTSIDRQDAEQRPRPSPFLERPKTHLDPYRDP